DEAERPRHRPRDTDHEILLFLLGLFLGCAWWIGWRPHGDTRQRRRGDQECCYEPPHVTSNSQSAARKEASPRGLVQLPSLARVSARRAPREDVVEFSFRQALQSGSPPRGSPRGVAGGSAFPAGGHPPRNVAVLAELRGFGDHPIRGIRDSG